MSKTGMMLVNGSYAGPAERSGSGYAVQGAKEELTADVTEMQSVRPSSIERPILHVDADTEWSVRVGDQLTSRWGCYGLIRRGVAVKGER